MSNISRRLCLPGKFYFQVFFPQKNNGIVSRVNSRIQRWSADYRLAIAQSVNLDSDEAGPSMVKNVASNFRSNYCRGRDLAQIG